MWESGCFPPSWHEVVVIPIPKPGKDHSDPGNFITDKKEVAEVLAKKSVTKFFDG